MSQSPEHLRRVQSEKLKPGHKLILPDPMALLSLAYKGERRDITDRVAVVSGIEGINEDIFAALSTEYIVMHHLLSSLVGPERMFVVKTSLISLKDQVGGSSFTYEEKFAPREMQQDLGSKRAVFLSKGAGAWPRDAHTLIDGEILTRPNAWSMQDEHIRPSNLGEGGKVLIRNKTLFVTKDIWDSEKRELKELQEKGFRVAYLPYIAKPDPNSKYDEDHLDCHASLLEDKKGELVLLVAKSYAFQGKKTRKQLREACERTHVRIIEIDDSLLPPLALNMLQFKDRSVAVTADPSNTLTDILTDIVGKDKVFPTEVPLVQIPLLAGGGIRCLTNEIPPLNQDVSLSNSAII